jgi:hypothetical protein
VTRTIVDGDVVYTPADGVTGVTPADLDEVGAASRELWDRL